MIELDETALEMVQGGDDLMQTVTCNAAASVIGEAAGIFGIGIALFVGGPAGIALAGVLPGVFSYAFGNGARDMCMNGDGSMGESVEIIGA